MKPIVLFSRRLFVLALFGRRHYALMLSRRADLKTVALIHAVYSFFSEFDVEALVTTGRGFAPEALVA